jgi:hypothetical protein
MLPIIGIIAVIAIVYFTVFAAKKKAKGQDLGETGNVR